MIIGVSGTLLAIRDAIAAYRKSQGDSSWFHLDTPATPDKIRMACRDATLEQIETANKGLDRSKKTAFMF